MDFRLGCLLASAATLALGAASVAQQAAAGQGKPSSSSSSSPQHVRKAAPTAGSRLDAGLVSNGMYRNPTLGFTCKIPAGWVLRTEEMNAESAESHPVAENATKTGQSRDGKVLLAAFSRPPQARGEDVNASILIAAESVTAYPGLKEAMQYMQPLEEVAKAQGFDMDEEPYEIAFGTKTLVRADFHKDVGTRVMQQSTLAMLARGYAVSITVIGGTEDDVEDLLDGIEFGGASGK